MSTGRFAFDIETINPQLETGEEPSDYQDPGQFELFSLCCAYQPDPDAEIEHEVFFREGRDPESELELVDRTLEWVLEHQGDTVITYNGDYFDFTQFVGRTRRATEAAEANRSILDRAEQWVHTADSVDLKHDSWDHFGDYTSFEETCEYCDVQVPRTMLSEYDVDTDDYPEHRDTADAMKPYFLGGDVPVVGERYLDLLEAGATETKTFREMHRMLEHYAVTDVVPLFELADSRPFTEYV
ncbi:hypothetical protein [Natrinema versiforme]|uniref:Uncharacterized protein n=1 Tax=Natrinema versiforme TaxID=88724 RepID=A0A4P8WME7_9EURY|nr:hypothetical protein [Natrinema versiforme]QCS44680.1 hypothetical protein FEJ81_20475 [Natrinema versiforme]